MSVVNEPAPSLGRKLGERLANRSACDVAVGNDCAARLRQIDANMVRPGSLGHQDAIAGARLFNLDPVAGMRDLERRPCRFVAVFRVDAGEDGKIDSVGLGIDEANKCPAIESLGIPFSSDVGVYDFDKVRHGIAVLGTLRSGRFFVETFGS